MRKILTFLILQSISASTFADNLQNHLDKNLINAVIIQDYKKVEELLKSGANPSNPDVFNDSTCGQIKRKFYPAIHYAVENLQLLKLIVENSDVNLNVVSDFTYCDGNKELLTPLMKFVDSANNRKNPDIIDYLVSKGADINFIVKNGRYKNSVLREILDNFELNRSIHTSIRHHLNSVGILDGLERLTSKDSWHSDEFIKSLDWLLGIFQEFNIAPNIRDINGVTFIDMLLKQSSEEAFEFLKQSLDLGANPMDFDGSPIKSILKGNGSEDLNLKKLELIKKYHLNLTPRLFADVLLQGQLRMAKALFQKEPLAEKDIANIFWLRRYDYDGGGYNPMFVDLSRDAIKLAISLGADINSYGSVYDNKIPFDTPLSYALNSEYCTKDLIHSLLDLGANPNTQVNRSPYDTPLMLAAQSFRCTETIFDLLIQFGANPDAVNEENSTALFARMTNIFPDKIPTVSFLKKVINISHRVINNTSKFWVNRYYSTLPAINVFLISGSHVYSFNDVKDVTKFFIENGADKTIKDSAGKSVLEYIDQLNLSEQNKIELKEIIINTKPRY